jgi:hypothetical protein
LFPVRWICPLQLATSSALFLVSNSTLQQNNQNEYATQSTPRGAFLHSVAHDGSGALNSHSTPSLNTVLVASQHNTFWSLCSTQELDQRGPKQRPQSGTHLWIQLWRKLYVCRPHAKLHQHSSFQHARLSLLLYSWGAFAMVLNHCISLHKRSVIV